MSVWYAIPSKHPEQSESLPRWKDMGYKVALFRDSSDVQLKNANCRCPSADMELYGIYKGYANAVNALCRVILKYETETNFIVTGGDDIDPDFGNLPEQIEKECLAHFHGTFGVMQPCGDRWMEDSSGRSAAERVCSSPWMGREFIERANGGTGPIWHEYFHFYEDEELHDVAEMLGVLWNRKDLTQLHHHWSREGRKRPDYLNEKRLNWDKAKALFTTRKAAGFPGHEPLEAQ